MEPSLKFNSLPSIALDAYVMIYGELPDFSDTLIVLESISWDPDGSPVATEWTEDCAANLTGDSRSMNVLLIPTEYELCSTAFTACDNFGCNRSTMDLDISCATLSNAFDPSFPDARPINDCFLSPYPPVNECVDYGWECGMGFVESLGEVSCGTCPDAGVCEDNVCIPSGDL
jgi:hypothetical protein